MPNNLNESCIKCTLEPIGKHTLCSANHIKGKPTIKLEGDYANDQAKSRTSPAQQRSASTTSSRLTPAERKQVELRKHNVCALIICSHFLGLFICRTIEMDRCYQRAHSLLRNANARCRKEAVKRAVREPAAKYKCMYINQDEEIKTAPGSFC